MLTYKKVAEACHKCITFVGSEAVNRNFDLTYFFIAPPNSLKLIEYYSFVTGGDSKKLSENKPMFILLKRSPCLFMILIRNSFLIDHVSA